MQLPAIVYWPRSRSVRSRMISSNTKGCSTVCFIVVNEVRFFAFVTFFLFGTTLLRDWSRKGFNKYDLSLTCYWHLHTTIVQTIMYSNTTANVPQQLIFHHGNCRPFPGPHRVDVQTSRRILPQYYGGRPLPRNPDDYMTVVVLSVLYDTITRGWLSIPIVSKNQLHVQGAMRCRRFSWLGLRHQDLRRVWNRQASAEMAARQAKLREISITSYFGPAKKID